MTFQNVIDQLKNNIEAANEKLKEAQAPMSEYAEKPYFHIMAQIFGQRAGDKAEDDLEFFVEFLNEHKVT